MAAGTIRPADLRVDLKKAVADEILRLLVEDSAFHERFQTNPRQALEERQIPVPDDFDVPAVELPPQDEIARFLETGYPSNRWTPLGRPYNGGCLMWSVLYGIASQTEAPEES
jgi:hypothetical protein